MNVTLQEAVDIHAHVLSVRFGQEAVDKADDMIAGLRTRGDAEGVLVHERVKAEIVRLQAKASGRPSAS